jgi:hypothetical protein
MMDEREKIKSSDILSWFDWMDWNLNFSFFFFIHSLVVRDQKTWQTEKKKKNEKADVDTIVLIKYLYNKFLSHSLRVCSGTREKNTIAMLLLNSPCMNSYHPHVDLLNKKRLSNLSRWWKLIRFLSTLFFSLYSLYVWHVHWTYIVYCVLIVIVVL